MKIAVALTVVALLVVLPPALRILFGLTQPSGDPEHWPARVVERYRRISTYTWIFANCKLRLDRQFEELRAFVTSLGVHGDILDIGCGFGIPGSSLLEWLTEARVFGLDPSAARAKAAKTAFGARGDTICQAAPDITSPSFPLQFDLVISVDVIHFLPDDALSLTLDRVRGVMRPDARLILRSVMAPVGRGSILFRIERLQQRITGKHCHYRSVDQLTALLLNAGFILEQVKQSATSSELVWFIAQPPKPA